MGRLVRTILFLFLLVAALAIFSFGCALPADFDVSLKQITQPHLFSILRWEAGILPREISGAISGADKTLTGIEEVIAYFDTIKHVGRADSLANSELRVSSPKEVVERTLERQIREVLTEQGIFNPLHFYSRFEMGFPPVNFRLDKPPSVLVVSPRERIESIREITLHADILQAHIEEIEGEVEKLGFSSIVTPLGGFAGTYPSFVTDDADLRFTLDAAIEEWLHQYLAFKPLGFRYLLDVTGISRNYEIATINEAAVGIVSREIGASVMEKYYSSHIPAEDIQDNGFDFDNEMREIRKTVDLMLSEGRIDEAEKFMEEKRHYLAENGYLIRKLNQAYFAFHGTYADRPDSVSPIGAELRELRAKSGSLAEFLETVAAVTSRQDLQYLLKQN